jgi:hypothetical protein
MRSRLGTSIGGLVVLATILTDASPALSDADLRVGYGVPFGQAMPPIEHFSDERPPSFAAQYSGAIPLQLDVNGRVGSLVRAGGYASYARLFSPIQFCGAGGGSCTPSSGESVAFGVGLEVHLRPSEALDPWVGVGMGVEWLRVLPSGGGTVQLSTGSGSYDSYGLGVQERIEAGLDWGIPTAAWGPFVQFAISEAGSTTHGWATLGVRGVLRFGEP